MMYYENLTSKIFTGENFPIYGNFISRSIFFRALVWVIVHTCRCTCRVQLSSQNRLETALPRPADTICHSLWANTELSVTPNYDSIIIDDSLILCYYSDSDVISDQRKWLFSNLPPNQVTMFTKLIAMLDHSDIIQCLDRAIAYSSAEVCKE